MNVEPNQTRCLAQSSATNNCTVAMCSDQLCVPSITSSGIVDDVNVILGQPSERTSTESVCSTVEGLLHMQYVRSAERAWQAYTAHNESVIVDTFHGQFKSTVG